jgi:predicted GH43/DUF377 family glycosyl hydrolase
MRWARDEDVFSPPSDASPDAARASGASVIEDHDGVLRMWYSGHDGSTARILAAQQTPGCAWRRLGVAIDAGFAGETDSYGIESPCVVRTVDGYLMAYAGSDGADTRLHMATSVDGWQWKPHGTFLQREAPDAIGATHPCVVVTRNRWWLFYAGYDGRANGRAASILAAVSDNGATWDRLGPVLEPERGELALTEPWVGLVRRRFVMLHAVEDHAGIAIALATSSDGMSWQRRGPIDTPIGDHADLRSPCMLRLRDGTSRMWYAANTRDRHATRATRRTR